MASVLATTGSIGVAGIPLEFAIFAAMLIGVAVLHHWPLQVALGGLSALLLYELFITAFPAGPGLAGLAAHFGHEWVTLVNLFLLLTGFAVLSNQFEKSRIPEAMPPLLPDNWTGGFALLGMVFVLSSFLDNIAAAVIGGVMAKHLYRGRVGIAFLASIVAAANAGGAGSVIGDTTTTLMWIGGVPALSVICAYGAAVPAFILFGILGARVQHRYAPIMKSSEHPEPIDWVRVLVVLLVLAALISTNVSVSAFMPEAEETVPALGLAIWATILVTAAVRKPDWAVARQSLTGAMFLVALVAAASLMPVEALPAPSWISAFVIGVASSVFDNIPLTALTLEQNGYDWALLAYAVGFGGSMVWFGSSAGVALTNLFPEGRSVLRWLREGWFVGVAYVVGFFVLLLMRGWQPEFHAL